MLIFVKNGNRYLKKFSDLLFLLYLTFKSKIKLNVHKPDQYKVNVISNNHDTFNRAFFLKKAIIILKYRVTHKGINLDSVGNRKIFLDHYIWISREPRETFLRIFHRILVLKCLKNSLNSSGYYGLANHYSQAYCILMDGTRRKSLKIILKSCFCFML